MTTSYIIFTQTNTNKARVLLFYIHPASALSFSAARYICTVRPQFAFCSDDLVGHILWRFVMNSADLKEKQVVKIGEQSPLLVGNSVIQ